MAFLLVKYSLVAVNIWLSSSVLMRFLLTVFSPGFSMILAWTTSLISLFCLYWSTQAAKTKYHRLCVSISEFFFFAQLKGLEVLRCHQGWFLVMLLLLLLHCILHGLFSCTQERRESSLVSKSSYEDNSPIRLGPPSLWSSCNLNYLLKPLSPNTVTMGVRI